MQSSIRLGRIAGIEIGVHYTWLLAFGLIAWSVGGFALPHYFPGWSELTYWLVGASAALLLFLSVLVHELSHSFVAQARGLPVHSITLFMFGGVSNITREAPTPRDEFLVAVVGPVSSLAIAALFWLLLRALGSACDPGHGQVPLTLILDSRARSVGPECGPTNALVWYLASVNLALGIFNLVPGFPLDGGRVFRSLLWALSRSARRATVWSSLVGQLVGWSLIAYGVYRVLFVGDLLGGVWMGFIGWFLNNAAEQTRHQQEATAAFRGVRVRDVMATAPLTVSPDLPVDTLLYDYILRQGLHALPVVDQDKLVGIVSLQDVRAQPQERWSALRVGDVMTRAPLRVATPQQEVGDALRLMAEGDLNQLPVVDGDRLVGLLSRTGIVRFLQLRDELHLRGPRPRPGGAATPAE